MRTHFGIHAYISITLPCMEKRFFQPLGRASWPDSTNEETSVKATLKTLAVCAALAVSGLAQAQDIKIANIVELSGPGTTAGTIFKNGTELAIKEINAAGGILGKKISYTTEDTQTNPGVAKGLTQKAVDNDVFAIFGPVYSGSIMVSMAESKRGETPNFTGGEAAAITAQGNPYVFRTAFGQSVSFPKLAKFINSKAKTLAVIYVNNDFGKGGRDTLTKLLEGSLETISEPYFTHTLARASRRLMAYSCKLHTSKPSRIVSIDATAALT